MLFSSWSAIEYFSDPNPSNYEIEGADIRFYNNSGKYLWSVDLGFVPSGLIQAQKMDYRHKRIQFGDYDGDGETEILIGTSVKNHEQGGALFFIETDGHTKWVYNNHPKLYFGGNEYSNTYAVSFMYPFKHSGSNTYDIYVSFSHRPWFPNQVIRFDIDGEVLNTFIHPGSLYEMEFIDLNRDGEMELLLGGTNNRFNEAVLCVLPSRNYSGSVPSFEDDSCVLDRGQVDANLVYMRFPKWGEYDYTLTSARGAIVDVYQDEDQGFGLNLNLGDKNATGAYIYHFNFELEMDALSVTDGFLSVYHSKFGRSFFEKYDQEKWHMDMSTIQVWRNGTWRSENIH